MARAGEPLVVDLLPAAIQPGREAVIELDQHSALEVVVPSSDGAVAAILPHRRRSGAGRAARAAAGPLLAAGRLGAAGCCVFRAYNG